jgi:serine/threonine-protein kinase
MTVVPGSRLGPYEITGPLGEGGMGVVYRATDSKLKREVAIKVLPEALAADADRLARFEREAQVLAQLQHPNIASIYGLEESGGVRALVMELAPGEDLAERLKRGPLPVDEALAVARQIAEALEAAHEKGIVHRDLKPANVKVTPDGRVKVLDFGLAKAMAPASGAASLTNSPTLMNSPTLTSAGTRVGVILGTAAYMAPEQAKGQAVDRRADIWAFGVVLYEMLSGRRLFAGDSVADTLAGVLRAEIDLSALPGETHRDLRRLLSRCLDRNPKSRLRDVGEARLALDAIRSGTAEEAGAAATGPPRRQFAALLLAGGVALGAMAALAGARLVRPSTPAPSLPHPSVRFAIATPDTENTRSVVFLSPDGRQVAWGAPGAIFVRRLDQLQPKRIPLPWQGTLQCWTRNGRLVVLRENRKNGEFWQVGTDGTEPRPIGPLPEAGFLWGVSQGNGGDLLFGMGDAGLYSIPLDGGVSTLLLTAAKGEILTGPQAVPGRSAILFAESSSGRIGVLEGGRRRIILERDGDRFQDPVLSPSGHLLVSLSSGKSTRGGWAFPFSIEKLETSGAPFRFAPYGRFSVSEDGTLAFREARIESTPAKLVVVDRQGKIIETIGAALPGMRNPALSPDGMHVAVAALSDDYDRDIFVLDRRTGARYPLPDDVGNDLQPFWRDGGETIGFLTFSAGIRRARERAADGSGAARLISPRALLARESPDGRYLVTSFYEATCRERGSDATRTLLEERLTSLAFSPDGRWVAYTKRTEPGVFLQRFPAWDGLAAATSEPVDGLRFDADGRELLYWKGDTFIAQPVDMTGDEARVGPPKALFTASPSRLVSGPNFDVTKDGFLMLQKDDTAKPAQDDGIVVTLNWVSEYARASQ